MTEKGLGQYYVFALRAGADITGCIVIPAVAALLLGKWLDAHFGTGKIFLVSFLVTAFVLTVIVLYRKIRSYGQAYQKLLAEPRHGATRS